MDNIIKYIREHRQQHRDELFQLLRIPSVSTDPEHAGDVLTCGEFLVEHLQTIGMKQVRLMPTKRHPVIYAEWLEAPDAPTILIYGHYDVQPPDPLELWKSPPFEPEIRQGEMYARGASDDKGQLFAHIKALETHFKENGKLPINVKLIFEGEEEIGSENLHDFVKEHADLLRADAILVSDSLMFAPDTPTICSGTRGLVHCQIDLQSADKDLHSGGFGGTVANPIHILADIIAALKDDDLRITIPGFYDDVAAITDVERQMFEKLPVDEEALKQETGVSELIGEKGYSLLERRWARPSLDVNGILGGFTGEGVKTIIPAKAMAKITIRLVPNQDPEKIFKLIKEFIERLAPPTVTLTVTGGAGGRAYLTPLDHPILPHVGRALQQVYGREPVFTRTGGSIGVLSTFEDILQIPVVLVALSQPDDNAHSPNEHLNEETFYKSIEVAARLLSELSAWKPE